MINELITVNSHQPGVRVLTTPIVPPLREVVQYYIGQPPLCGCYSNAPSTTILRSIGMYHGVVAYTHMYMMIDYVTGITS